MQRNLRTLFALAGLIAALTASGALAQDDAKDEQPHALASTPGLTPSRAVGRTHDCAGYYPDTARRANESGDVMVRYDVGADGAISHVTVARSSGHADLDNAAAACVTAQWRNTPARQNGVAVASPGHLAIIRFTLHGAVFENPFSGIGIGVASFLFLGGLGIMALALFLAWAFGGSRRH